MAHFSQVNEVSLLSSINENISSLKVVKSQNIEGVVRNMKIMGADTKRRIDVAATSLDGYIEQTISDLESALNVANLIKNYKSQKKIVDSLKAEIVQFNKKINLKDSERNTAHNKYNQAKGEGNEIEASHWYGKMKKLSDEISNLKVELNKKNNTLKTEEEKLEQVSNNLKAQGFDPLSY